MQETKMGTPGVVYKIGGKYSPSAEQQAIKGIQNLTAAAKTFNLAVKGFVVAKVFQGIKTVMNGSSEAFTEQRDAESSLFASIQRNAKLAGNAFGSLKQQSDSLTGIFDGSAIETQQKYLVNMQLNEQQIHDTMSAAVDLAATGMVPLDQATKMLSESYSGNTEKLKKINPEIGKLTAAELKNGEAVKIIAAQYKGMAQTMEQTFSGRDKKFSNIFGDLQASVGSVWASLKFEGEGALMAPIQRITDFITGHQKQIINFFLHLPEIAGVSLTTVGEILQRTFSPETFLTILSNTGKVLLSVFVLAAQAIGDTFNALANTVFQPLKLAVVNIAVFYKNTYSEIANFILEAFSSLAKKVLEIPAIKFLYEKLSGNKAENFDIKFRFQQSEYAKTSDMTANIAAGYKLIGSNFAANVKELGTTLKDAGTEIGDQYSDILDASGKKIGQILNKDLPSDLKKALNAASGTQSKTETAEPSLWQKLTGALSQNLSTITGSLGQLGSVIQNLVSGNPIGILITAITSFISALSSIDSFNKVLNVFSTVFEQTVAVIGPTIDAIFTPIATILQNVGQILGAVLLPFLEILNAELTPLLNIIATMTGIITPIAQAVGNMITLLIKFNPVVILFTQAMQFVANTLTTVFNTVIRPVLNFCITIVTGFVNIFIGAWNGVVDVLKKISLPTGISISWHGISVHWKSLATMMGLSEMDYIDANDYKLDEIDGTGSTSGSSSAGTDASYTAAKDVYVTININNSYVNGDARQIAIALYREIKSAEKLGLVS